MLIDGIVKTEGKLCQTHQPLNQRTLQQEAKGDKMNGVLDSSPYNHSSDEEDESRQSFIQSHTTGFHVGKIRDQSSCNSFSGRSSMIPRDEYFPEFYHFKITKHVLTECKATTAFTSASYEDLVTLKASLNAQNEETR